MRGQAAPEKDLTLLVPAFRIGSPARPFAKDEGRGAAIHYEVEETPNERTTILEP
jgi:hypothetical protein